MNTLQIFIKTGDDGTGEVFAKFEADNFSGCGSAWFDLKKLAAQAESFAQYPLSAETPPRIEGGYWNTSATKIDQEHLHISAYPINSRGAIGLLARVAVPHENPDRVGLNFSASVEFKTNYEQLRKFSVDLRSLALGELSEVLFQESEVD
jgi:hypothetical protein